MAKGHGGIMKICSRCKSTKNLSEFSKDCSRIDGYSNKCKECRKLYKTHPRIQFEQISEKTCSNCILMKEISNFRRDRRARDGYQAKCKDCFKKSEKIAKRHKEPVRKQYLKNRQSLLVDKCKTIVINHLKSSVCVDCGENDILVLDFDHIDPHTKEFSISRLVLRGTSTQRLKKEMAKCEIRCANCHRKRTAIQFGSWKIQHETHYIN